MRTLVKIVMIITIMMSAISAKKVDLIGVPSLYFEMDLSISYIDCKSSECIVVLRDDTTSKTCSVRYDYRNQLLKHRVKRGCKAGKGFTYMPSGGVASDGEIKSTIRNILKYRNIVLKSKSRSKSKSLYMRTVAGRPVTVTKKGNKLTFNIDGKFCKMDFKQKEANIVNALSVPMYDSCWFDYPASGGVGAISFQRDGDIIPLNNADIKKFKDL